MNNSSQHPLFSFYKAPISNIHPCSAIDLPKLCDAIRSKYYQDITNNYRAITVKNDASEYKTKNFDYVTINGIFSRRNDASLIKPSGYMVLDIDDQENVETIKQQLINDKELQPLLSFVSPSGSGLKVVVEIDISLLNNAANTKKLFPFWQAINTYLAIHYSNSISPDSNGNCIDPSGCDLSRACFICHDPNCFINPKFL